MLRSAGKPPASAIPSPITTPPAQVTRGDSGAGVDIVSGVAETVLSNSIYSNSGLSIDLGNDEYDPGDPLDLDSGPNSLQEFPHHHCGDHHRKQHNDRARSTVRPISRSSSSSLGTTAPGKPRLRRRTELPRARERADRLQTEMEASISRSPGRPNFVAATATDPSGNTSEFSLDLATTVSMADLSVTLAAAPNPVIAGTDLTYKLTVHTGGPSDALGVIASDTLPTGTSFVSASGDGTLNNGAVTWDLGTIAAGAADTTLTLVVLVNAAQTAGLSDTANVASTTPDPVSYNNATATTTVTPATNAPADLSLTVLANSNSVVVGQDVTYTLVVHIAGQSDALGVIVTDPLPAGTSFVSASGGGTFKNGTTIWDLGTIAAGSPDTTLTLVIQVNAAQPSGLTDTAFVSSSTSDPVPGNNRGTATITVTPAPTTPTDLAISNSDSPNPVIAGSDLTYTLTVYAAGPSSAARRHRD